MIKNYKDMKMSDNKLTDQEILEKFGDVTEEQKQIIIEQNSGDDNEDDIEIEETEEIEYQGESPKKEDETPKDRKLNTEQFRISVREIQLMITEQSLYLTPEYQRSLGIWDLKRKSQLIESLLLNIPIPPIYCIEIDSADKILWEIIDGLQRISAINEFSNNKFKLKGLEELTDLNDKNYKDLEKDFPKAKQMFDKALLSMVLIKKDSDSGIKFDVFARLNTGSVKLNTQELRNCIYRGDFNTLLKYLRENQTFLSMISRQKKINKRMTDAEMVLRFFTVYSNINFEGQNLTEDYQQDIVKGYKGSIKPFLTDFMKENQNPSKEWIETKKQLFENTIELVDQVLGKDAFRRGTNRQLLNLAIFDLVMTSFALFDSEKILEKKDELKTKLLELLKTDEMNHLISTGTNSKEKTTRRFILWFNKIWDILYA